MDRWITTGLDARRNDSRLAKQAAQLPLTRFLLGSSFFGVFEPAQKTAAWYGFEHIGTGYGRYGSYGAVEHIEEYHTAGFAKMQRALGFQRAQEVRFWPCVYHGTSLEAAAQIVFDRLRLPQEDGCSASDDDANNSGSSDEDEDVDPRGHGAAGSSSRTDCYGSYVGGGGGGGASSSSARTNASRPRRVAIKHGQNGTSSHRPAIYSTPCLGLAACPRYAPLSSREADRKGRTTRSGPWLQVVLKLKVRPGSYRTQDTSPEKANWDADLRLDPNLRSWRDQEFLTHNEQDVEVIGVMFRLIGPGTDSKV